jgi:hypothetical protein
MKAYRLPPDVVLWVLVGFTVLLESASGTGSVIDRILSRKRGDAGDTAASDLWHRFVKPALSNCYRFSRAKDVDPLELSADRRRVARLTKMLAIGARVARLPTLLDDDGIQRVKFYNTAAMCFLVWLKALLHFTDGAVTCSAVGKYLGLKSVIEAAVGRRAAAEAFLQRVKDAPLRHQACLDAFLAAQQRCRAALETELLEQRGSLAARLLTTHLHGVKALSVADKAGKAKLLRVVVRERAAARGE